MEDKNIKEGWIRIKQGIDRNIVKHFVDNEDLYDSKSENFKTYIRLKTWKIN